MGQNPQRQAPEWWHWDLVFTAHVEGRMEERDFSEVELRGMISDVDDLTPGRRPGRYLGRTKLRGQPWVVVLEPDPEDQVVVVVTAYRRERS
jgi:hypothetical protein